MESNKYAAFRIRVMREGPAVLQACSSRRRFAWHGNRTTADPVGLTVATVAIGHQGWSMLQNRGMTVSIPETEAFIQFKLSEMSSRNEHHEFEEIATRIARKRISSNILIATGPVSSGGDQQRDAESYKTRIPDELPHSAGFSASASTTPIVVACTVQKDRLKQKVLDDLAGICADDADPVDHVAFFSAHTISEGITHDLKTFARKTHNVTLDIFCGPDIATLLAEADLVWVAQHYLDLPSTMVPFPDDDLAPGWYVDLLGNLRNNDGPAALTPATQGEITRGLRYATWEAQANSDLPEWLDFMGAFLSDHNDGQDTELTFRACYEMAVARFRGMGVAIGVDNLVRRALEYACSSDHPNVVDDAVTLTSYWGTMWSLGVVGAEATEIAVALNRLRVRVTEMLESTESTAYPVRAATLTGVLAFSYLIPDWSRAEREHGQPCPVDITPMVGKRFDDLKVDVSGLNGDWVDIDSAMKLLTRLVDLLPMARAYSVRELAKVFNILVPLFIDHPSYLKVRDGLDEAIAAVEGDAALADRCRNRAIAFIEADRPLEALLEMHRAKVKWFNGDTLYGAILAMRYIASVYEDLGLMYAAKMYACVAAALAAVHGDARDKEHLPKALLEAARYSQKSGNWADAAAITEVALLARAQFLPEPFDYEKYPELSDALFTEALEVSAVRKYWPELEYIIEAAHTDTEWFDAVNDLVDGSGNAEYEMTESEFQDYAAEQLAGPVFGDLGPLRVIDFAALGIRWTFTFTNDRTAVLAAEGLCAAFQVFLADVGARHPVLLRSAVHVRVDVRADVDDDAYDFTVDDPSPEPVVHIVLPADSTDNENYAATVAVCSQLLDVVHARPFTDMEDMMESVLTDGLIHKLSIGRPYGDAAGMLLDEHYARCAQASRPASSTRFKPIEAERLAASTVPGTGYDQDEALQAIRERYEVAYTTLRYTYPRLLADEDSRGAIIRLREAGWLDWQILVTLVNVAWNWRLQQAGIDIAVDIPPEALSLARQPETAASVDIPLQIFSDFEVIKMHAKLQVATVAQHWRLQGPAVEAPTEETLRDLLTRRYRYSVDDVPHRDILDCVDGSGYLVPFVASGLGGSFRGGHVGIEH